MTSNFSTNHDDYDDEQFPQTSNDQPWPEPPAIPNRRDLLTYAQALKSWKLTDKDAATIAGLINSNRIQAYHEVDGQLSPFTWFDLPPDRNWRTKLPTLLFNPVPDLESETRYLDYSASVALLKKHLPKMDAAELLEQEAIGKEGLPTFKLVAISLTSSRLTEKTLKDCIFLKSQIESWIASLKNKDETKKRKPKARPGSKEVEKVYLDPSISKREDVADQLNCSVYHVRKNMGDLQRKKRGRKPKI